MKKKYVVKLSEEERTDLQKLIATGKAAARKLLHARILLKADASPQGPGWSDTEISQALEVSLATIQPVRQRFVEQGVKCALERRLPRGQRSRRLDGEGEAHLVALACSAVPAGHTHWSIRMLADKLVELGYVEGVGRETVRKVLKNELKPWRKEQWCIPPKANAQCVCNMEEVLEVYKRPYDRRQPQVCLDETSKQVVSETRVPLPAEPGQVEGYDYEYERQGVCSLFMCFEPLRGWRQVTVSARRTKQDWAHVLRELVDVQYPDAQKIILVMDNLNTHDFSSLYETFTPQEARRIREKLEIHSTPKHGSWLNMAEIELAVLSGQCLDRRIGEEAQLRQEVAAWEAERNGQQVRVNWRFTTQDARIKLKRLYPILEQDRLEETASIQPG